MVHLTYVAEIIHPAAFAVKAFESKYVVEDTEKIGLISSAGKTKDIYFGMLKGHIQQHALRN